MQNVIRKEPTKISESLLDKKSDLPIRIYYHIGAIDTDTENIVAEQINLLKSTELYQAADTIYCSIVGRQKFSLPDKFEIVYKNEVFSVAELPILKILQEHSKTEDFKCLYFHTKGSSANLQHRDKRIQTSWRKYMEHFCISKWKQNIALLDIFDTIGTSQIEANNGWYKNHYAGNFWWSKSEYIKTLIDVEKIQSNGRFKAEMLILSNPNVKAFNWHKREGDTVFGSEYYDPSNYINL